MAVLEKITFEILAVKKSFRTFLNILPIFLASFTLGYELFRTFLFGSSKNSIQELVKTNILRCGLMGLRSRSGIIARTALFQEIRTWSTLTLILTMNEYT